MDKQERQLEGFFNGLPFDDIPDPQHRDALERQLSEKLSAPPQRQRASARIWRLVMKNRIAQLAAAAAIAVALLVPLSHATSNLVRGLIAGSYAKDSVTDDFKLDRDIWIELEIGTKEQPQIIRAGNVRFFVEDGQLRGSLRCDAMPWPERAWRTEIELLDAQGEALARTEYVRSSNNVPLPREEYLTSFPCAIRFAAGPAESVSEISRFRIGLEAVSPDQPITPDDWATSNVLAVVHGRVTDADDKPVPGATVQIREQRRPGQTGIAAPDVFTDQQGFYCYDQIDWPYRVGAIVYEPTPSGRGQRHQYQGGNAYVEGSQQIDFVFGPFPEGSATLSGVATEPNGAPTKEFTVDARLRIGWDDDSAEYRYTYGRREPFTSPDGHFEISGLAAGTYLVFVLPERSRDTVPFSPPETYTCQLQPGQETVVGRLADSQMWYGCVLFDDGSPAVSESQDHAFHVIAWAQDGTPRILATLDDDGYFAARLSQADMDKLRSGQAQLKVALRGRSDIYPNHLVAQGEVFPVERLSSIPGQAGAISMARPRFYYGRLLYENGEPAVPPAAPWSGAKVAVRLRYTPATSSDAGVTERMSYLGENGEFVAYLTDEQFGQIRDGRATIEVLHPSFKWEWESHVIGRFPGEKLSTERDAAGSYVLPVSQATGSLSELKRYLDSAFMMETLAEALSQYADQHGQAYPPALQYMLASTTESEALRDQIEYFPARAIAANSEATETVLAYDRALLEATGTTHVLFADGHLEFCRPRRLEVLGIVPSEVDVRP